MQIDLDPHDWKSEREKPYEPFFGSGAPGWGLWLIGFTLAATVAYWLRHL